MSIGDRIGGVERDTLGTSRTVAGRNREVRRALKHRELLRFRRDDRDGLNSRRAGADYRHALTGEVHPGVGPAAGPVHVASETIRTGDIHLLRYRETAGGHHVVLAGQFVAINGPDPPPRCAFVPGRRRHSGGESNVSTEVEAISDVLGVAKNLGLGGVLLRPLPLLLQRPIKAVGVVQTLHVAAGTRVAVPVPGAADIVARFEDHGRKTQAPKPMEQVHAGKSSANDDHVEVGALMCRDSGRIRRSTHRSPGYGPRRAIIKLAPLHDARFTERAAR